MNKYIPRSLSSAKHCLLLTVSVLLCITFQNCDRDNDPVETIRKYHCPQENFTNDCTSYKEVGSSLGYGYTGKRAEATTFIPGNGHQILFTERNGDDASVPGKVVLYNWKDRKREVLSNDAPFFYDYSIAENRMVCAKKPVGPIVYFHLDSLLFTIKEVPFNGGVVRDPVWLRDGRTIVYLADSSDLKFNLASFDIEKKENSIIPIEIPNVRPIDLIVTSISPDDQILALVGQNGFYKVDFHNLTYAEHLMSPSAITMPAGTVSILAAHSRMYYAGPWLISYGENDQEYGIRDLCPGDEQIQYMDVSDDEKYIVYMFEYPVKLQGGVKIMGSKLRIIDIENCKEYDINPFE